MSPPCPHPPGSGKATAAAQAAGLSLPLCGAAAPRLVTLGAAALRMLLPPGPPGPAPGSPPKGSAARPETFGMGTLGSPGPQAPFRGPVGQNPMPNAKRPLVSAGGTNSTKMVLGLCLSKGQGQWWLGAMATATVIPVVGCRGGWRPPMFDTPNCVDAGSPSPGYHGWGESG